MNAMSEWVLVWVSLIISWYGTVWSTVNILYKNTHNKHMCKQIEVEWNKTKQEKLKTKKITKENIKWNKIVHAA